jgi:glycosyltransferase involved in cell wall biosynthesis
MVSDRSDRPTTLVGDPPPEAVRVALLCDFLEEKWPSMDLTADMLYQFLVKNHAHEIATTQLRPQFHPRLTTLPMFRERTGRNVDRLLNRFLDYPLWLRRQAGGFDLFHLADHSYSQLVLELPPGRTIVTCHDLDSFRCLLEPEKEKRPRWFQAMARRVLRGFQQAAHVICNSGATRDQLLHYHIVPPEKLSVIHVGVQPVFSPASNPGADAEAARLIGPNSAGEIRLLSVGSTIPRKRMDILLRVFAKVRAKLTSARLIRVGGPFTEAQRQLAAELGIEEHITILPSVSGDVLAAIYRLSTLLLVPSESEGFGMPLTEALACGCPVLASDLAVLREVGGPACDYCAVGDVEAWTRAVLSLVGESSRRSQVSGFWPERAKAQAARYCWAENARQTVQIYEKVFQTGSGK